MDREYLEDYEQREEAEYKELVLKRIREGKFDFKKDKYPADNRFVNLQYPVALASYWSTNWSNIWAQVPFCGSLVLMIPPFPKRQFERELFKISDIPKIIDFVKETGKLQIMVHSHLHAYEGLDFLDPFFEELKPPTYVGAPIEILEDKKEVQRLAEAFLTLAEVKYVGLLKEIGRSEEYSSTGIASSLQLDCDTYVALKLLKYEIAEKIENLLIDEPAEAFFLLSWSGDFLSSPICDLRATLKNYTFDEIKMARFLLSPVYKPQEIRFPCEIGKFLQRKLTYAPQGMRACYHMLDNYSAYDLQKVQESLNKAIVENHPDIVNKKTEELSQILDNVWNDKTVPRRIKGLQIGIPISMGALGSVAAGPIGMAGGLLAGLGYSVADKFIDLGTEGLSERLAKLKTRSYQANIYEFKKKYKSKVAHE